MILVPDIPALSYLKLLPVSKIKIDKVFISSQNEYYDLAIMGAITTMAHQLNIKVIAEGIENEAQLKLVQGLNVDGIQGYYYSHPLSVEDCEEYLINYFNDTMKKN